MQTVEISVKGKAVRVPAASLHEATVIVTGRGLKVASIKDEFWLETEVVTSVDEALGALRAQNVQADLFTFSQKIPNFAPRFQHETVWDNLAVAPIASFAAWWDSLPQEARKNVRRAGKRGVSAAAVPFNDELVRGIVEINNETPVRQGRPFWHYGKSFEVVKREYSDLQDRSEYIGAFHEGRLIGFTKVIYMGRVAAVLQNISLGCHSDKRPSNVLIAKAVEVCAAKGITHLIYGNYIYGKNDKSPLTEFKRRNGFQQMFVPTYFVPMSAKGSLALRLGLHRGLKSFLPQSVTQFFIGLRGRWYGASPGKKQELASPTD